MDSQGWFIVGSTLLIAGAGIFTVTQILLHRYLIKIRKG